VHSDVREVEKDEVMEDPSTIRSAVGCEKTRSSGERMQRQLELDLIMRNLKLQVQRQMLIQEERFARMSKLLLKAARKKARVLQYMRLPLHDKPLDCKRSRKKSDPGPDAAGSWNHSSEGGEAAELERRRSERLKFSASAPQMIGGWPQNLCMDGDGDDDFRAQRGVEVWGSWKERYKSKFSQSLSNLKARLFDSRPSSREVSFTESSTNADATRGGGYSSLVIHPVPFDVGEFGFCLPSREGSGVIKASRAPSSSSSLVQERVMMREISAARSRSGCPRRPEGLTVIDIDRSD
jgi:hypothetical protein